MASITYILAETACFLLYSYNILFIHAIEEPNMLTKQIFGAKMKLKEMFEVKIKFNFLVVIFGLGMALNLFPQDNLNNDPFLGVWFSETDKLVQIYINGMVIQIAEISEEGSMDEEIFKYAISGDSLIINDEAEYKFIVVDDSRIILELDDFSILLVKQNGTDIIKRIKNFLD
jgi:hypothetical protein